LTGGLACYGIYRCADGELLSVAPLEPGFFAALLDLLDLPAELAEQQFDPARQSALRAQLAARLATRTAAEWEFELAHHDTCVARVVHAREVAEHPQLRARGAVESLEGSGAPIPASPFVIDGQRAAAAVVGQT
jgi:alpha-methylacyl-CoA racemase